MSRSFLDVSKYTVDAVLFLPNVFKRHCKQTDCFVERIARPELQFDTIPSVFTGLDGHPKTTNLRCWSCVRTFKGRPWFEPLTMGPRGTVFFTTRGNFCTAQCTKRWITIHTPDLDTRINKTAMLKIIYEIFTGRKIVDIAPAPLHTEMIQYGGSMTTYDYQEAINALDPWHKKEPNFSDIRAEDMARFVD